MNGDQEKAILGDPPIGDVENSANSVLSSIFNNLKANATVLVDQPTPRLFFPNGIELITITVKIGTIDIELEIAGANELAALLPRATSPSMTRRLCVMRRLDTYSPRFWFVVTLRS